MAYVLLCVTFNMYNEWFDGYMEVKMSGELENKIDWQQLYTNEFY